MIWLRYVNDVFAVWPAGSDFQTFFTRLNDLHPSITLKVEWEKDNRLPFLDILINRDSSKLKFSIYRNPTNSNAYIRYFIVPRQVHQKGVILGPFLRGYRICDKDNLQNEVSEIYRIFTALRYPEWFIHDAHMSARRTFFTANRSKKEKHKKCLDSVYVCYMSPALG